MDGRDWALFDGAAHYETMSCVSQVLSHVKMLSTCGEHGGVEEQSSRL